MKPPASRAAGTDTQPAAAAPAFAVLSPPADAPQPWRRKAGRSAQSLLSGPKVPNCHWAPVRHWAVGTEEAGPRKSKDSGGGRDADPAQPQEDQEVPEHPYLLYPPVTSFRTETTPSMAQSLSGRGRRPGGTTPLGGLHHLPPPCLQTGHRVEKLVGMSGGWQSRVKPEHSTVFPPTPLSSPLRLIQCS